MKRAWSFALAGLLCCTACSRGESPPPAAESTVTPAESTAANPTPTAPPSVASTPTPAFGARALQRAQPTPFPSGVVMYAIDGVWEGPTAALRRYYRDSAGQFRVDDLVLSTFGQGRPGDRAIVGVQFGNPGEVGVALCHGICYGSPEPVTIARSADGGVTWHDLFDLEAGGWGSLLAIEGDTTIIRGPTTDDWWSFQKVTPSGRTVLALPAGILPTADTVGAFGAGQRVAVYSEDRRTIRDLLSGELLLTIPPAWDARQYSASFITRAGGESVEVQLLSTSQEYREGYLAFIDTSSDAVTDVYQWREADGLSGVSIVGWITPTLAIGRADFDQADYLPNTVSFFHGVPALIDLQKGTVSPISEFLPQLTKKAGGPQPLLVDPGSFARVVTGADCLNVRSEPLLSASVLGCMADRVVMARRAEVATRGWVAVTTPDGRDGWASSEFLELFP